MSNSLGSIKRGDTFNYYVTWAGANLEELASQIRTGTGRLLSEVQITGTASKDVFQLTVEDTTNWPIGTHYTDIQRVVNGVINSSATLEFEVTRDFTK
jgi:hypothetical protein